MHSTNHYRVTVGGWYPRTTLHLSEIYSFLKNGASDLSLSKEKLTDFHKGLRLKSVTQETGNLEYIYAITEDGIEIIYYEDGLYIISAYSDRIPDVVEKIEAYLNARFNPAIAYIFSLGAPTPKVLAHFPIKHPVVVCMQKESWNSFSYDKKKYGEVYAQIESSGIVVYKTLSHIFVLSHHVSAEMIRDLVEMQIFFREFKDQLKRYLNIHRVIWEEISTIKEQKSISARQVDQLRSKLDGYQKTINLISNRINQMSAYITTRSKLSKTMNLDIHLLTLFQYKFESLTDSHTYIKEIWNMTREYIGSAIAMFTEIQNKSTQRSIQSLQLITLSNVIATLLAKMAIDKIPGITVWGFTYVIFIIILAWILNSFAIFLFKNLRYRVHFPTHTQV